MALCPHATYYPRVARYARQPWAIKSGTPMGFVYSANILGRRLPSPWRGVGGEALAFFHSRRRLFLR